MILQDQKHISPYRGLSTDGLGQSATAKYISGETVQLYYNSSGTLTADAGQAAGTAVLAVLRYDYILDAMSSTQARLGDSSLSFTSTAFTSEVYVTPSDWENYDSLNWKQRLTTITANFTNGQYAVDYRDGTMYGKKASTQSTLTSAAYAIATASDTDMFAFANVNASSTDTSIVAAVAGYRICVTGYTLVAGGTATNVTFNSKGAGAGTAISSLKACAANGGVSAQNPRGVFKTNVGEALTLTTGTGSTVGLDVTYELI